MTHLSTYCTLETETHRRERGRERERMGIKEAANESARGSLIRKRRRLQDQHKDRSVLYSEMRQEAWKQE